MNDLILKARERELIIKSEIEMVKDDLRKEGMSEDYIRQNDALIKQYVETTPGQKFTDAARGAGKKFMDWSQNRQIWNKGKNQAPGQQGPVQEGEEPMQQAGGVGSGEGITGGRGVKGLVRNVGSALNPANMAAAAGKIIGAGKRAYDSAATTGQQVRTKVTPEEQARVSEGQKEVVRAGAEGNLAEAAEQAGKASTETPLNPANDPNASAGASDQTGGNVNNAGVDPNQQVSGGGVTDTTGQPNTQTQTQTQTNTGQGQGQGQGQGTPQNVAQVAQIQDAQQQAQTKGGIGTGVLSNVLTFGLSGALRGGYNAMQRAKGRERLRSYGQGDFSKSLQFQGQLNDAYSVIALRKGYEARNTTEMLRNGGR